MRGTNNWAKHRDRALIAMEQGDHAEAARQFTAAVELLAEPVTEGETLGLIQCMHRIGDALIGLGKWRNAIPWLQKAQELADGDSPAGTEIVAAIQASLGDCYAGLTRNALARTHNQRALAMLDGCSSSEPHLLARVSSSLAELFSGQPGREQEVERLLIQGVGVLDGSRESDAVDLARLLHRLGTFYDRQGRGEDAQRALWRAVSILQDAPKQVMFESLPVKDDLLHSILEGGSLASTDRLEKVLAIASEVLPQGDPAVPWTLYELARACGQRGQIEVAESLLRRSVALYEARDAECDSSHIWVLQALGDLLKWRGQAEEGQRLLDRGRRMRAKLPDVEGLVPLPGSADWELWLSKFNEGLDALRGRHGSTQDLERAEGVFLEAMELAESRIGREDFRVLDSLVKVSEARLMMAEFTTDPERAAALRQAAESSLCQVIRRGDHEDPLHSIFVATAYYSLARLYLDTRRCQEAETAAHKCVELRRLFLHQGHPALNMSLDLLVEVQERLELSSRVLRGRQ